MNNEYDQNETQRLMGRYPMPQQSVPMQAPGAAGGAGGAPIAYGSPQGGAGGMGGGGLPPELVQAILSMQQQGAQKSSVDHSRALAKQLRADSGQQLQGRQTGAIYTPPNWLNAAASIAGNYRAGKMEDQAGVQEQNMGVQNTDAMRKYFEAMSGRKGVQPQLSYMGAEGE
jgi:hypothetical protein